MEKTKKFILWTIIASESSHIFCCVLPTVFSVILLLSNFGMAVTMPVFIEELHAALHDWEIPIIIFSAVMLALGWVAYYVSKRIDCHDTGCHHGPCEPRKDRTALIMGIATVLLVVNVSVYFVFHRAMDISPASVSQAHEGHDHHGHDHHDH